MNNFDFIKNRKWFAIISGGILVVALIFNLIFGVELDIAFKGGTLLKYSYSGDLKESSVALFVSTELEGATISLDESGENGFRVLSISLSENMDTQAQADFKKALLNQYPNNDIKELSSSSPEPAYGRAFFLKCLVAIVLASLFLMIYVGLRFRKIGGLSAGAMALLALLHDVLFAYFTFVILRIPLNDNFVAVVLAILGYSLNDTIVIYDRIRENRSRMNGKASISEIVNLSLNQSLTRNVFTSVCVLIAIGTVAVVAVITSMESIISFAIPMTVGVIAGFFSSTFLCTPFWALWVEKAEQRAAAKSKSKKKK